MAEDKKTNPVSNQNPQKPMKKIEFQFNLGQFLSKGFLYVVIAILFFPFLMSFFSVPKENQISLSGLVRDVSEDKVGKVEIVGSQLIADYKDESQKVARKEEGQDFVSILKAANIDLSKVDIKVKDVSSTQLIWNLLLNALPIILMVIFFFFIFRQARGAQDGIMGIGKSKAKLFIKGKQNKNSLTLVVWMRLKKN